MPQGVSADLIATEVWLLPRRRRRLCRRKPEARRHCLGGMATSGNSVIPVKDQNGLTILAKDEHHAPGDRRCRALASLKPVVPDAGRDGRLRGRRASRRIRKSSTSTTSTMPAIPPASSMVPRPYWSARRPVGEAMGLEAPRPHQALRQHRLRSGADADRPGRRHRSCPEARRHEPLPTSTCSSSTKPLPPSCSAIMQAFDIPHDKINVNGGADRHGPSARRNRRDDLRHRARRTGAPRPADRACDALHRRRHGRTATIIERV